MINPEMPHEVHVIGIDGCGKSSVASMIKHQINIGNLHQKLLVIDECENNIVKKMIDIMNNDLPKYARSVIVATKVFYEQNILKPINVKNGFDYCLSVRDQYVDPIVYGNVYFPKFINKLSIEKKNNLLETVYGPSKVNHYIYLQIDPFIATKRVISRCLKNSLNPHQHESLEGLKLLSSDYLNVLDFMESKKKKKISIIDTNGLNIEQVSDLVLKKIG